MNFSDSKAKPPRISTIGWSLAVLILGLVAVWPAFGWLGYRRAGWEGIAAAALALAVCGSAAVLALFIAWMTQLLRQPISGILAAMVVRAAPPLLAIVAIPSMDEALLRGGAQGMFLGYYLVGLLLETWLSLRLVGPLGARAKGAA